MSSGASNENTTPGSGAAGMGTRTATGATTQGSSNGLQDKAAELAKQAKSKGQAELDQYRKTAVGQVETLAESARAAANTLKENDTLGLSHYVADVADGIQGFAGKLRGKSIDELIHDASDLARNNPVLFIAGSIAIGFGLTRFVKASTKASGVSIDTSTDQAADGSWSSQATSNSLPPSGAPQHSATPGSGLRHDL